MKRLRFNVGCALFLASTLTLATSCSDQPRTAQKKEAEKVEPVTGQTALWRMYQLGRNWSPDAQVLTMSSTHLADVPVVPGKASGWQAKFTSASKSMARSYTFGVTESVEMHQGAFALQEESFSASAQSGGPFLIAAVKTDSDAAYETALKQGGDEYGKKNPGKRISFILEKTAKHTNPAWRVLWGESVSTAGFSVYVDATTGEFLERVH